MKFTLNRDRVHASVLGLSVEFKKGVPAHVPPELYAEVQAIGAIPEDEIVEETAAAAAKTNEPSDPNKRKEEIFAAFEMLALRNERTDFTAGGAPRDQALESILGWKLSTKERDVLWTEFKVGKDD